MSIYNHIYTFTYDENEMDLCKLESKYIFGEIVSNKLIFSNQKVKPSSSTFIKSRIDVLASANDYEALLASIKKSDIKLDDFKVEYLVLDGDDTEYQTRLRKQRDIGVIIKGVAEYYNPSTIFALCKYEEIWYFGKLTKNDVEWHKHNDKPHSYSNSISVVIGKSLVNIAAKGDRNKRLLDACCGVGTIMLEACFADYIIEGCDINWKICRNARENIAHFAYEAKVHCRDIQYLDKKYDAAIVDLPYNLVSKATESQILNILASVSKLTDSFVVVSIDDISQHISDIGFHTVDTCLVRKKGKRQFARKVWVCEKA